MATVAEALTLAWQHQASGNLGQAEQLGLQVLQVEPTNADAYHLLGVINYMARRFDQAAALLRRAVELNPWKAPHHSNLGLALQALGQVEAAAACYQHALRLQPDAAETHTNLASALLLLGKREHAVAHCRESLRLRPHRPETHFALGVALGENGELDEAAAEYRAVLRIHPGYAEAYNNLANVLSSQGKLDEAIAQWHEGLRYRPDSAEIYNNLGNALLQLDKVEEAVASCQEAVRLAPNVPETHNNLGNALAGRGDLDGAVACFQQAVRINARFPLAHNNLGTALVKQGKFAEATACFRQALQVRPDFADARFNLGNIRMLTGHFDEAEECYDAVLRQNPKDPDSHFAKSLLWLLHGKWAEAWPEYEWRWQTKPFPRYSFSQPRWGGSPSKPAGRTVLLIAEQGLGDNIQVIRYAQLVQERGYRVVFRCPTALLRLTANAPGIDQLVAEDTPLPPFDAYAPLLSLPGIFQTSVASIPTAVPYFYADAGLVEHWRRELEPLPKLKIGIAWQGAPSFASDRQRSVPLSHFARLAEVPGVQLISLQKGPGVDQLAKWECACPVLDLGSRLDESSGPFMDTAAIMMNVDLVISSDSSVAHLAGALGVPVWTALSMVPDWRWLLERQNCPWYPSMRMVRQSRFGCWEDVFDRMVHDLSSLLAMREDNCRLVP